MTMASPPRADAEIFADARLARDRHPDMPDGVLVHVLNRVVTLAGDGRLPRQRQEAERVVASFAGVRHVVNQIIVNPIIVWPQVTPQGWEAPADR
jgi:hypothetical protein